MVDGRECDRTSGQHQASGDQIPGCEVFVVPHSMAMSFEIPTCCFNRIRIWFGFRLSSISWAAHDMAIVAPRVIGSRNSKRSQQHYSRPDKLRQRREDEKVVKSHDGCKSRSLVSSAPLPEAAVFFTSKFMATCAAFASPPVGLPDWSARFTGYTRHRETQAPRRACPV